jgi:hypothetical protein
MTGTIPTWGYRQGASQIFELKPGEDLPKGWYDSPAKIPDGDPGQGGEPAGAASHPAPQASPPPPSIDEQERAEHARVLAENAALKARVAELEAHIAGAVPVEVPEQGLPPVPGAEPSMREILANSGPPLEPEPDLDKLREEARQLGIQVDNRWGAKRLMREIAYVKDDDGI